MKVIRGTRAAALAAACAMLIIGAGAADAPATEFYYPVYFLSSVGGGTDAAVEGGVDGCPVVAGSTPDPRELCRADLGAGWTPSDVPFAQLCPPGPIVFGGALHSGTLVVTELRAPEPDPASAIADVRARVRCYLNSTSALLGPSRKLPATAIPGTDAEGQLVIDRFDYGVETKTILAIGPVVLILSVSDDSGVPDSATVMRIVNAAIHRFRNPRPFVTVPAPRSGLASPP
jgi:hypothetical protein